MQLPVSMCASLHCRLADRNVDAAQIAPHLLHRIQQETHTKWGKVKGLGGCYHSWLLRITMHRL